MRKCFLLLWTTLCVLGMEAHGDGGRVQMQAEADGYVITLLTSPTPLRAGPADISVLVQDAATRQPILNAEVMISLHHATGDTQEVAWEPPCCSLKSRNDPAALTATLGKGNNKLLYCAMTDLPFSGSWDVAVRVNDTVVRGEIQVDTPPRPVTAYWPFFLLPPLAVAGFVLRERIARR